MKMFRDKNSREWKIEINIGAVKRVRDLLKLDLLESGQENKIPALTQLGTDIVALIDTIFVIVKPQADQAGISDEQFAEAIGGQAGFDATNAFYEELADFFQSLGRNELAKATRAQKKMLELTIQRLEIVADQINPENEVEKIFGNLSTNLPGQSE
jgi:hypothetical protein